MRILINLLAFGLAVFTSCSKSDTDPGNPACIDSKIATYSSTSVCGDAKVDQYTFQGKTVYVFEPGTCGADMSAGVLDADCNALGDLGGFIGNTKINGEEFSNAKFIRTVWKK